VTFPAGLLSPPLDAVERMLAACASFRNRIASGASVATARQHIHWHLDFDDGNVNWRCPMAVLWMGEFSQQRTGQGASNTMTSGGGVVLVLVDNARQNGHTPEAEKQSAQDFCDWAGTVLEELAAINGSGDYLHYDLEMLHPPQRTARPQRLAEQNDYWETAFQLSFGHEE